MSDVTRKEISKAAIAARTALIYLLVLVPLYPVAWLGKKCDAIVVHCLRWAKGQ